ncbi:MAG: molybdopterin-dependent oxidoreductase [Maricaulaceae bacterium]
MTAVTETQTHFRTCHLCETMCGIAVEHDGENILSIKGDPDHVLSKGNICPKAIGLQDIHTDPDRLRRPVKKVNGEFVEISWEEAFEETASQLARIQKDYGDNAVATYQGRSTAHNIGALLTVHPLRQISNTQNTFTGSTVDQQPHNFVWYFMLGHQFMATVPNIDKTDYFLLLGSNPKVSNGAMMSTGANTYKKLEGIQARGGKVVLIDPRRTESAKHCSEHHFIKPATDALLLIGLIKTIFAKGLADKGRLGPHIKNWEKIEPAIEEFDLLRIAKITGISEADIERIAVEFATAPTAVCYGRTGLSMQTFGGLCNWLMMVMNLITANFDEPGGMMFPTTAVDTFTAIKATRGSYDTYRSRVSGRKEFAHELPVSVLAEEIMTPGEGKIRGLVAIGGNGALSMPNGKLFEEAMDELDFMVAIDPYINETTRHASIILPPIGPFEKSHYDMFYHTYDTINWAAYNPKLFEPEAPGYSDFEIMRDVLSRWAIKKAKGPFANIKARTLSLLAKFATVEMIIGLGLRFGHYGPGLNPFKKGLTLKTLKDNPHGVYLGEPERRLPEHLFTEDKMIDAAPEVILADLPRLKSRWFDGEIDYDQKEYDLLIISRLTERTLGWMHHSKRLVKGPPTCTLFVNPKDAKSRKIKDGDIASVTSAVGSIEVPIVITDDVMPGVICMPHAWGHNRKGTRQRVANAHAGASLNDITDHRIMDELTGNAVVHGVPVKIAKVKTKTTKAS